jgi:hypothetical protein
MAFLFRRLFTWQTKASDLADVAEVRRSELRAHRLPTVLKMPHRHPTVTAGPSADSAPGTAPWPSPSLASPSESPCAVSPRAEDKHKNLRDPRRHGAIALGSTLVRLDIGGAALYPETHASVARIVCRQVQTPSFFQPAHRTWQSRVRKTGCENASVRICSGPPVHGQSCPGMGKRALGCLLLPQHRVGYNGGDDYRRRCIGARRPEG